MASDTTRAEYVFSVKEYVDGTPWIMMELLRGPDLPIVKGGFLGFDLRDGTTMEEATALARTMSQMITTTAHTKL